MADSLRLNQLMIKRQNGTLSDAEKDELIKLLLEQLRHTPGHAKVST